jgi:hypothetical protein
VEAHGEYSSIAKFRTKIPAIFLGVFGIFRGISKLLFIYSTTPRGALTMFCGTLVGSAATDLQLPLFYVEQLESASGRE